jgi:hypothetical protein
MASVGCADMSGKCLSVTCQDNQLSTRWQACTGEDAFLQNDALRVRRHAHHGRQPGPGRAAAEHHARQLWVPKTYATRRYS